jgi:hypothetical protein
VHMPEGGTDPPRMAASAVHPRAGQVGRRPGNGATDGADQGELAPGDDRRWVMSHTTCVLPTSPVFRRVSLTRRRHRWASPVSRVVSPVPSSLVSKSVSRCALWPAASWIFVHIPAQPSPATGPPSSTYTSGIGPSGPVIGHALQTIVPQRGAIVLTWPDDAARMLSAWDRPAHIPRGRGQLGG